MRDARRVGVASDGAVAGGRKCGRKARGCKQATTSLAECRMERGVEACSVCGSSGYKEGPCLPPAGSVLALKVQEVTEPWAQEQDSLGQE